VDPGSLDVLVIGNRITTVGTGIDAPLGAARCLDNFFSGVPLEMDVCAP
jgi:hypothetical protein